MANPTLTLAIDNQRMTAEQYEAERARLRTTYGESNAEAGARREQALALLFDRSGWTQEELAKKEGEDRTYIARRLLFGRFLNSVPMGTNIESIPANLTERRFRSYWERTDKNHKEHSRFAKVSEMVKEDLRLRSAGMPRINQEKLTPFYDGKWHALAEIAAALETDEERAAQRIGTLRTLKDAPKVERKPVGKSFSYRIFKPEKMVSATELIEKLGPIIKELTVEGITPRTERKDAAWPAPRLATSH